MEKGKGGFETRHKEKPTSMLERLDPDRVKYIVHSLFSHVGPFRRQERSSCVVQREELFTIEELKRAGGMLRERS